MSPLFHCIFSKMFLTIVVFYCLLIVEITYDLIIPLFLDCSMKTAKTAIQLLIMVSVLWPLQCMKIRSRNRTLHTAYMFVLGCFIFLIVRSLFNQESLDNDMYGHQHFKLPNHKRKVDWSLANIEEHLDREDLQMGIRDVRVKHLLPYHNRKHHRVEHPVMEEDDDIAEEPFMLIDESVDDNKYCNIYNLHPDAHHDYDCVLLQLNNEEYDETQTIAPKVDWSKYKRKRGSQLREVPICLYPVNEDIHISYHIKTTGKWEPHIVQQFQDMLHRDAAMGVIDIGANIGVYSLVAAHMGHKVVAVEPFIDNIHHFHEAVKLSGTIADKITLLQNAVLDKRGKFNLGMDFMNQGGITLDLHQENAVCDILDSCHRTTTIYLDDLLEVITFKRAIIKIDIEGFEHHAFRHSSQLFNSIDIPYIIMEWLKLREFYGTDMTESTDKTLTDQMVQTFVAMGYHAHSLVTGEKLSPKHWFGWPNDILWKHNTT